MNYTETSNTGKDFSYLSPEVIENYSKKARTGPISPTLRKCPVCETSSEEFKRHDARKRQFYIPVKQIIQIVYCYLVRWRCPGCKKRILQYPDFALPYKRYTLQTTLEYSAEYVENDAASYESVLRQHPVGYQEYPGDERQLDRSTVRRWVGTFGQLKNLSQTAHQLILQADPASLISRHLGTLTVPARKYATNARKNLLIQCRKLLHLEEAYKKCFSTSLFPNLATAVSFS